MTSLSEAAQYAIAQARERMAELKRDYCRCGVPRDQCGDHKNRPAEDQPTATQEAKP